MTFSIRSIDVGNPLRAKCEIIIGDDREVCTLITTLWACKDYESQWIASLQALSDERVDRCVLITDIQPSEDSVGLTYWALFRESQDVYLQERFLFDQKSILIGSATAVAPNIPSRIQGTPEEHSQVSEWTVSIGEVRQFVEGYMAERNVTGGVDK
jgi:hypothetical protein